MAIPNIPDGRIKEAFAYIDVHGVPWHHESTLYNVVSENGTKYPPKYVIAVANHLANGVEIKIKDSEIEFMKLFNMVGGKTV